MESQLQPNYKYWCINEKKYISVFSLETPTKCINDPSHSLDHNRVYKIAAKENKYDGICNPTKNDDISKGFNFNSIWINQLTNQAFICIDNQFGNALWKNISITEHSDLQNIGNYTHKDIDDHIDNTTNPHNVTKEILALENVQNIKIKLDATRNPSNMDDSFAGYNIGSHWMNIITKKEFVCVDNQEDNATWTETTNIGEIVNIQNIGSGDGLLKNKSGSIFNLKTIVNGDNITIKNNELDITIQSKNTHSFILTPDIIETNATMYKPILYFPWLHSEYYNFRNGKIILYVMIDNSILDIALFDNAFGINQQINNTTLTDNKTLLGSLTNINVSGVYSFPVSNPPNNTLLTLAIKKRDSESSNPTIYGVVLKYDT